MGHKDSSCSKAPPLAGSPILRMSLFAIVIIFLYGKKFSSIAEIAYQVVAQQNEGQ